MKMARYKSLVYQNDRRAVGMRIGGIQRCQWYHPTYQTFDFFHLLCQSNEFHFHTRPNRQSLSLKTAPRWLMKEVFLVDLIHLVEIFETDK